MKLKDMLDTLAYDDASKEEFIRQLGCRINEERLKRKFTTGEFAELCGISDSCLFNVEKGRSDIHTTNLLAICLALDMTLNELIPPPLYRRTQQREP